jgi:hypothetical protein
MSLLQYFLSNTVIKAKCGHIVEKKYVNVHDGLCRKCHSNFSYIIDLVSNYGEDALVQYWYAMILTRLSSGENEQESICLIEHLNEYYQRQLVMVPSKEKYIKKMLYMLNSLQKPFDIKSLQ